MPDMDTSEIIVNRGDKAADLAKGFCIKFGLNDDLEE